MVVGGGYRWAVLDARGTETMIAPRLRPPAMAICYDLSENLFLDAPTCIGHIGDVLLF